MLSVDLPCLEGQLRRLIVSAFYVVSGRVLIKGSFQTSQNEPKRCCSDMGEYRDTGTVDDMRRSGRPKLLLQLMTATYGVLLGGTLKATPPR